PRRCGGRAGAGPRPPLPFTPGVELCGEVLAAGPGVTGIEPGDRLIGGAIGGAFAELTLMNAASALPAPPGLDDAEAGAFFITYHTGWVGLHRRGPAGGGGGPPGGPPRRRGPGGGGAPGGGGRGR